MAKTVFDALIDSYEEDVSSATKFLASGGVKNFDEYKEVVGRIRGLQLAIQSTKDLSRNFMEDEDE
jgi:hypothetical protein